LLGITRDISAKKKTQNGNTGSFKTALTILFRDINASNFHITASNHTDP
jgi:hypothetical protein